MTHRIRHLTVCRARRQTGAVLLVSMIILVVLTLLTVYALRAGSTNLRIAGNAQIQAEAAAATEQAVERTIELIKSTDNINAIVAQSVPISIGNATYTVTVQPLTACLLDVPIRNDELSTSNANDIPCFEGVDADKAITSTGALTSTLSGCKNQQWEIQAGVTDAATGASVTHVQGISIRVPATTQCL